MMERTPVGLFVLLFLCACGGSGGSPNGPTGQTGPQTETFTGTAQISATGVCSNDGHAFNTREGNLSITLVQSSNNEQVAVQVCHPTATDHATQCTVPPFHRIAVGMTLGGTVKGGAAQVLTVYPGACGTGGTPAAASVTYTIRLEHP
jgi:hypothetical protein